MKTKKFAKSVLHVQSFRLPYKSSCFLYYYFLVSINHQCHGSSSSLIALSCKAILEMRQFDWKRATKMTSSGTHGEFPYWKTVFSPCTLTFEAVDGIPWCCRSNKTFTVVSLTLCVLSSFTRKFWVSSAWMKSCSVTIQMKSHLTYGYFRSLLSISCINRFWILESVNKILLVWPLLGIISLALGKYSYIAMQGNYFYYFISTQVYLSGASTEWHHRKNAWKIQRTW